MKRHVPNIFSCLNLFCGCIATALIFHDQLSAAAYLIIIAAFFDLIDGLSARLLNVGSAFGKQLDSIADTVSFGLVPASIMFKLLQETHVEIGVLQYFPFIITIFSALRLAKFNIDTRQTDSFIGLPTPANTLVIISLPLILAHDEFNLHNLILNPWFILALCVVQSFLLVSPLPLLAVKFKSFGWQSNRYQYLLIILSIVSLIFLKFAAIPVIILLYIILSLVKVFRV